MILAKNRWVSSDPTYVLDGGRKVVSRFETCERSTGTIKGARTCSTEWDRTSKPPILQSASDLGYDQQCRRLHRNPSAPLTDEGDEGDEAKRWRRVTPSREIRLLPIPANRRPRTDRVVDVAALVPTCHEKTKSTRCGSMPRYCLTANADVVSPTLRRKLGPPTLWKKVGESWGHPPIGEAAGDVLTWTKTLAQVQPP